MTSLFIYCLPLSLRGWVGAGVADPVTYAFCFSVIFVPFRQIAFPSVFKWSEYQFLFISMYFFLMDLIYDMWPIILRRFNMFSAKLKLLWIVKVAFAGYFYTFFRLFLGFLLQVKSSLIYILLLLLINSHLPLQDIRCIASLNFFVTFMFSYIVLKMAFRMQKQIFRFLANFEGSQLGEKLCYQNKFDTVVLGLSQLMWLC